MKQKRIYKGYLIEITTKNKTEKTMVSNKMKVINYIHEYLKKTYKDYKEKDYIKYQTFATNIEKNKNKEINKQTKGSYITVKQYIIN